MSFLQLTKICKRYGSKVALQDVDLEVDEAQIVGLAGESGSGKSTLAKIICGMEVPESGSAKFLHESLNLSSLRSSSLRKDIQLIFQNALASFNPKFKIYDSLALPISFYWPNLTGKELKQKIFATAQMVKLDTDLLNAYPHQLSGGQIQRAAIGRAISCEPKLIIADEPTSALDVSIRSQILHLFKSLVKERSISCLVISHDLSSLKFLSEKIYILNQGQVVEASGTQSLFENPRNSYTKRLLSAMPSLNPADQTFAKFV